jgi:TIR domain
VAELVARRRSKYSDSSIEGLVKIFISWSGLLSRRVAEILRDWLPDVLQAVQPYVSSKDIDKGTRWNVEISKELEACKYGIICVTAENVAEPWLNFEAGALSKSFEKGRVSPFLYGIGKGDLGGPMKQFQSTIYEHDDMLSLVQSINRSCDNPLPEPRVEAAFEQWWPNLRDLVAELNDFPSDESAPEAPDRSATEDILTEILHIVREIRGELASVDPDTAHLTPLPTVRSQQDTAGSVISPVAVPRRRHSRSADVPPNEPLDTDAVGAADRGQEWLGHLLDAREHVRLARNERGSAQRQLLDALDGMAAALRAALAGDASRVPELLITAQEIRNDEGRRLLVAQQHESDAEASLDAALRSLLPSGE